VNPHACLGAAIGDPCVSIGHRGGPPLMSLPPSQATRTANTDEKTVMLLAHVPQRRSVKSLCTDHIGVVELWIAQRAPESLRARAARGHHGKVDDERHDETGQDVGTHAGRQVAFGRGWLVPLAEQFAPAAKAGGRWCSTASKVRPSSRAD
jgi:hypothetical protein